MCCIAWKVLDLLLNVLVLMEIIATRCIMQKWQYSNLGLTKQPVGRKMPWQVKLKTSLHPFVAEASIKMSWKCLSHSVAFHFVFNLVCQLPAIASSLLFLPDQAKRGCGLNMSLHQQATSNLPPFVSMVPINTLLAPRWEATDSEGDRKGRWCDGEMECMKEEKKERWERQK